MRRCFVLLALLVSGALAAPLAWAGLLPDPFADPSALPGAGSPPIEGTPWPHSAYLPMIARSGNAAGCTELLADGSFESGGAWNRPATSSRADYVTTVAHSGVRSMRVGLTPGQIVSTGDAPTHSSVFQTVYVPVEGAATLSFAYNAGTDAPSEVASGDDLQQALILDGGPRHDPLEELTRSFENSRTWHTLVFDAGAYRGRLIDVAFAVRNNNTWDTGRTWLYIDDVSLLVCPTALPTEMPGATATPSPQSSPAGQDRSPAATTTATSTPAPLQSARP